MIYSLSGSLKLIEENYAVVECGGVGYKCFTTANSARMLSNKIGTNINVYTYMSVREDAVDLFGFLSKLEMDCFKKLTSVSGVGAKVGLAILSEFSPDQVLIFIASGDSKSLTRAQGVGNKLAQRIVLELKDKIKSFGTNNNINANYPETLKVGGNINKAAEALCALGCDKSDVIPILSKLDSNLSVEEMINLTLKEMN